MMNVLQLQDYIIIVLRAIIALEFMIKGNAIQDSSALILELI